MSSVCYVWGLSCQVFVLSSVCYVYGLLCVWFVMSRVCFVSSLSCLGSVMSRVCYVWLSDVPVTMFLPITGKNQFVQSKEKDLLHIESVYLMTVPL